MLLAGRGATVIKMLTWNLMLFLSSPVGLGCGLNSLPCDKKNVKGGQAVESREKKPQGDHAVSSDLSQSCCHLISLI